MIAGPEAHRIRRALESVAEWAREIIVVINEDVHDGTDRISADYGAKVFREPWRGFIAQKNSATEKASSDWLLGLDADEVISPELRVEITSLLSQPASEIPNSAYSVPRCTFYCGRWIRHGDWYPDRKGLLWRRGQAQWTGVEPHAVLIVNGSTGRLKHDLWHYSFDNIDQFIRKALGYSHTFAQQPKTAARRVGLLAVGGRPLWCFFRGYFLRLGFLDGQHGIVLASLYSFYTFLKYAKLWELQQRQSAKQ